MTKRSSFPSKLGKHVRSTTTCMYKHIFCLKSAKYLFCSLGPIAKCVHCQQYDLACLSVANNTKKWEKWLPNSSQTDYSLCLPVNPLPAVIHNPGQVRDLPACSPIPFRVHSSKQLRIPRLFIEKNQLLLLYLPFVIKKKDKCYTAGVCNNNNNNAIQKNMYEQTSLLL